MTGATTMLSELQAIPAMLGAEFADVQVVSTESLPGVPTGCCYGIALPSGVSPLGDRPTIGLDVPAITEAALEGREAACCRAVLVHELGHLAVEPPREWSQADTEFIGADMLPLRARLLTRSFPSLKPTSGPCPHHGARFIRAAMHVYGRAQQLGLDVPLEIVGGVGFGWLSPERDYFRVLQGEINGLRGESFATILATPAPDAFAELWAADVALYHQQQAALAAYHQERAKRCLV